MLAGRGGETKGGEHCRQPGDQKDDAGVSREWRHHLWRIYFQPWTSRYTGHICRWTRRLFILILIFRYIIWTDSRMTTLDVPTLSLLLNTELSTLPSLEKEDDVQMLYWDGSDILGSYTKMVPQTPHGSRLRTASPWGRCTRPTPPRVLSGTGPQREAQDESSPKVLGSARRHHSSRGNPGWGVLAAQFWLEFSFFFNF